MDRLQKEREFNKGLQDLKSAPVEMVDDFKTAAVKDFPVEKISTAGEIVPVKSGGDFLADQIIGDARRSAVKQAGSSLDYNQLRKEFAAKAKMGGRKVLGAAGMIPGVGTGIAALGGLASALASQDASAGVPVLDSAETLGPEKGSFDDRLERGLLTDEEKQQLKIQALKNIK